MIKVFFTSVVILVFFNNFGDSQLRNVRLVDHAEYLVNVVQATITELEERGWSNLKIPDTEQEVNETIFDSPVLGSISYKNGFLVSIQHVDIQQSTVQQVWNWTHLGLVDVRGRLRMHNVVVGFDVFADLSDRHYKYTGEFMHPLVNFDFSIVRDLNEDTITANVVGVIANPAATTMVHFMPADNVTDILNQLYIRTSTVAGMLAWGPNVITPITNDIVNNKIEFATVCYNCPV